MITIASAPSLLSESAINSIIFDISTPFCLPFMIAADTSAFNLQISCHVSAFALFAVSEIIMIMQVVYFSISLIFLINFYLLLHAHDFVLQ